MMEPMRQTAHTKFGLVPIRVCAGCRRDTPALPDENSGSFPDASFSVSHPQ